MIKSKTGIFRILFSSIFSLFILVSCGSVPKQEITQPVQEENAAENEPPAQIEQENTVESEPKTETETAGEPAAEAEKTDAAAADPEVETGDVEDDAVLEKVSEDELLEDAEPQSSENQDIFVEPEVQDSPVEEQPENRTENQEQPEEEVPENADTVVPVVKPDKTETDTAAGKDEVTDFSETKPETGSEQKSSFGLEDSAEKPESGNCADSEQTGPENPPETEISENPSSPTEEKQDKKVPSRSMTVKNSQYVDVVYPGQGWIYMGEEGTTLFRYFGKKIGTQDTTVTLRSIKSGKTLLHFYKNDVLTGEYIDDYLEAEVLEENAKPNERAKAPSYAQTVPPKPVRTEPQNTVKAETEEPADFNSAKKTTETDSQIQSTEKNGSPQEIKNETKATSVPKKTVSSKTLLEQAKKDYNDKNFEKALSEIQEYLDTQNEKIDEALFVQGQILEADSEVKNIKSAIDSYNSLIKRYPASPFWQEANRRKIYLNRYYVNIY